MTKISMASPQGKTRYELLLLRLSRCRFRGHKAHGFPEHGNLALERNTIGCKHISLRNVRHLLLLNSAISASANWQPPSDQEDDGKPNRLLDAGHSRGTRRSLRCPSTAALPLPRPEHQCKQQASCYSLKNLLLFQVVIVNIHERAPCKLTIHSF